MRFQTKRVLRKIICTICASLVLMNGFNSSKLVVCAAESEQETKIDILQAELMENVDINLNQQNVRTMLVNCDIYVSFSEAGLHIEISTGSNGVASVLGIKDIVIMKKVWYGWKTIATGNGGEAYDCTIMGLMIDYPNVEVGETYRITCTHYGTVDEYTEAENDTGGFVFQY